MKLYWLIVFCLAAVLVGDTKGNEREVVTRGVAWLDSPETVRLIEKNRRDDRNENSYSFTDVYKDRLNDETKMVVKYEFLKFIDKAPGLVEIRIDFTPAKEITFLAVGERLQERYGEIFERRKDERGRGPVLQEEAGVSYYLNPTWAPYGHDMKSSQWWRTEAEFIFHEYSTPSSIDVEVSHTLKYEYIKKEELKAAADSIKLRLDLERARQSLGDDSDF